MTGTLLDDVVARGRKTVVRRKRVADSADEYRWRADEQLAQYDASRPVTVPVDSYSRNWAFDFRFTDMPSRSFAIEDAGGRRIGNVMYYNVDKARGEAEIGISIGERDCWEQGFGSDALRALTRAIFLSGNLRRLYLHTLDWNIRARRAFLKAGFEETGTSWRDGHTFVVMELRREWVTGQRGRVPAAV